MTTQEIKNNLGLDITKPNRKLPIIFLKSLYVEQRLQQLKDLKKADVFRIISYELNIDRTAIYNLIKQLEKYKTGETTYLIVLAFEKQEKKYINDYYKLLKQKQRDNVRLYDFKKKIVKKIKENAKPVNPLMSNLKLAEYMRKNNIKTKRYWDEPITLLTEADWLQLKFYNPEMFDFYLE
jgi:hypothetical protein